MLLIPKAGGDSTRSSRSSPRWWSRSSGILLLTYFDYDQLGRAAVRPVDKTWIAFINSRYIVGLDGICLPLLAADDAHRPAGASSTPGTTSPSRSNPKAFLILILILETGMIGTFVAQDLILFFVFFEVVLLPMYFMIGVWGGEQRQYASIKFFLYTLFGSALMIVSFLALVLPDEPDQRPRCSSSHVRHAAAAAGGQRHRPTARSC